MNLNEREQLDLLVSRIADSEATDADWQSFNAIAEREPIAWKQLAQAQRDQAALGLAVNLKLHAAERVDLPTIDAARRHFFSERAERSAPWGSLTWGGWAAAAAVLIAWIAGGNFFHSPTLSQPSSTLAGWSPNSTEEAVKAYLDIGKKQNVVLGEVPQRIYVQSRPTDDGRMEVIYMRQFVERAEVKDMLKFAQDEAGSPVPVRMVMPPVAGRAD
jgi:hypothetical protein